MTTDLTTISDGVAIIVTDEQLSRMGLGEEAARRLENHVKKTIEDAGYDWEFQYDEQHRELRIIPRAKKEIHNDN